MALTLEQKNKLVDSGILKQYAGKSWDEIEKYAPMKSEYNTARANLDADSMQKANDLANAIRRAQGVPEQKANVDIAHIRELAAQQQPKAVEMKVQPQATAPSGPSNANLIDGQFDSLLNALRTRLQQNIANRKAQSQPLRNDSEVRKAQELRTVLEQNANAGDRGGVGRQNALTTQVAGDNRLISINNAENTDIANMQSDASVQEAQTNAERLRALIEENRYADETAYNRGRDSIMDSRYASETDYNRSQDALDNQFRQSQFDYQKQSDAADREFRDRQFEESIRQNNIAQSNWEKQFTYAQMQDKIQNSLSAGRLSLDQAQLALSQARLKAEQDPNSLDNQIKKLQLEMAQYGRIDDIRTKAAQMATASGYFDQETYEVILGALEGKAVGTGMQQRGLSIDDDLNQYFR